MRGRDQSSGNLFSYVDLEERVPDDHPLRLIREIVNDVLGSLSSEFETLYSHMGRPSIPPEKLLRALLLQAFYSIRIFSSAEYCLRVLRRISRTVLSAGSFLLIDFCLIFVPFGHYDEPEILRYAITSIFPKALTSDSSRR